MRLLNFRACAVMALALAARPALAGTSADPLPTASSARLASNANAAGKVWSFSASASSFTVPDSRDFVQPTFTADHDGLHLEARYNYEGLDAGSVWLGANFLGGQAWTWELTPILGGVFGDVSGFAPGLEGSLNWRKLELYSEGEYLIDTGRTSESFYYNWSELSMAPPNATGSAW